MDLVYHRYANPVNLLNQIVSSGRLSEFVDFIVKKHEEEVNWQYYLHKVFDKTFNEFTKDIENEAHENLARETFDVETTLQDSINMTMNCVPPEEKG